MRVYFAWHQEMGDNMLSMHTKTAAKKERMSLWVVCCAVSACLCMCVHKDVGVGNGGKEKNIIEKLWWGMARGWCNEKMGREIQQSKQKQKQACWVFLADVDTDANFLDSTCFLLPFPLYIFSVYLLLSLPISFYLCLPYKDISKTIDLNSNSIFQLSCCLWLRVVCLSYSHYFCECDISGIPWGTFFKITTILPLVLRMDELD